LIICEYLTLRLFLSCFCASRPKRYISLAEAFVQQVRQLEAIFRREKGTLETEDLERNEEMDRLRPAVERLNELQTVFEASGIPNYDKVYYIGASVFFVFSQTNERTNARCCSLVFICFLDIFSFVALVCVLLFFFEKVAEAVAKAMEATDAARTAIDGPTQDRPPTRVLRDLVRDAQQLVLVAERTYNEEVDRKAHLERETSAASGELEQVELRLDAVATEIEESGMTVAHLSEEAYSVAENAVAQAKKLLRKNASPGEIRLATQQAIDSVRGAEDSLDKHKSRLVQVGGRPSCLLVCFFVPCFPFRMCSSKHVDASLGVSWHSCMSADAFLVLATPPNLKLTPISHLILSSSLLKNRCRKCATASRPSSTPPPSCSRK